VHTAIGAARRRARGDEGVGLVEVLVTVAILGIAFVAILSALAVTAQSSRTHRVVSEADSLVVAATEAVKGAVYCDTAQSCIPETSYDDALDVVDLPTDWTDDSMSIESVSESAASGRTVQDITVGVQSPDGKVSRSFTISKTSPPPTPPTTVPPPTDVCDGTTVTGSAFGFIIGFVLVEIDIPPDAEACVLPMRARVGTSGPSTQLSQNPSDPTRWSGWLFSWTCFLSSCQAQVLQGDSTPVLTLPVDWLL
jgi:Tfp pilus assembly protein FimT